MGLSSTIELNLIQQCLSDGIHGQNSHYPGRAFPYRARGTLRLRGLREAAGSFPGPCGTGCEGFGAGWPRRTLEAACVNERIMQVVLNERNMHAEVGTQ